VSGVLFEDVNSNGRRDRGERGVASRPVWIDVNRNGRLDRGEPNDRSARDGSYEFASFLGTHLLRVSAPGGYWRTYPSSGARNVTLTQHGQAAPGKHFGVTNRALVRGSVFADANRNGKFDRGEGPVRNWVVWADKDDDGRLDIGEKSVKTDSRGLWSLALTGAGRYTIRAQARYGWQMTTPVVQRVVIGQGKLVGPMSFGLRQTAGRF
jgi:hypothetical protein